jgi:hypothetical protein
MGLPPVCRAFFLPTGLLFRLTSAQNCRRRKDSSNENGCLARGVSRHQRIWAVLPRLAAKRRTLSAHSGTARFSYAERDVGRYGRESSLNPDAVSGSARGEGSNELAALSPFPSSGDYITNTSGYYFRKGQDARRQKIKLLPRQIAFIRKVYDVRTRIGIDSAPRRNGKTGLVAACALARILRF